MRSKQDVLQKGIVCSTWDRALYSGKIFTQLSREAVNTVDKESSQANLSLDTGILSRHRDGLQIFQDMGKGWPLSWLRG